MRIVAAIFFRSTLAVTIRSMESNPYEAPKSPATRPGSIALWSRIGNALRRFPITTLALVFAAIITVVIVSKEYAERVRMEQEGGVILLERSPMDKLMGRLALPGLFCGYVAVTFTKSLTAAIIAGVLGMAMAYGIPGLMVDLGWRQLTGRQ
jgi:hypothetical protein